MSSDSLSKGYEPHDVEKKWYDFWQKENLFAADETSDKQSYSIVIPPPNVTGALHMGHALTFTMQDILCRYRRLKGDNVLWMPGTDHAGIATQNVVEKKLAKEGISRKDLGREKFIEHVWEWKEEYGGRILNQLKRLGSSCDWPRERFTMDKGLTEAVKKVFVQLYKEGLIYQGQYITNWCPRCNTALSDLEVEHEEAKGALYHIKYPFADESGYFTVATTRPETMFGDTALAINPNDDRYKNINADKVKLPLTDRIIPVIKDDYVDTEFGTGALKVTPAHDPNDFDIGTRHNLESVKVIDDNGNMMEAAGTFKGLDRFECRKKAVEKLKESGLLVKVIEHDHSVGHCYRCNTVVEPNLSKQWFVKIKPLAEEAINAVKDGKTKIVPEMWEKTYFEWMNNIRDWCISRQIWWGHRIPAWKCDDCSEMMVEIEAPEICTKCGSENLNQETDVLDTWFSSALWPFSTMGWPENTELLKTFYPTSVLVTGFDILFFWVARMMMMGLHFKKEIPFKDVYIHALVRDEHGKKMSKSTGNVIDPLTVIDSHGTDSLRLTLAAFAAQGRDIKLSLERVEGYRHFINKLWNATRFALMHIDDHDCIFESNEISLANRWILSRLRKVIDEVALALDEYRFNDAVSSLYKFVWHEFCDWYVEAIKPALFEKYGKTRMLAARKVLFRVLKDTVTMLHPFIPFVTEEIWHKLPCTEKSVMKATYPSDAEDYDMISVDEDAERKMELFMQVITGIRNIRAEMKIPPSQALNVVIHSQNGQIRDTIENHKEYILSLARLKECIVDLPGEKPKAAATAVIDGATVFVDLEGIIDFHKEAHRLESEMEKLSKELIVISKKLSNEGFLAKAPDEVVNRTKEKHDILLEKQEKLQQNHEKIKTLI